MKHRSLDEIRPVAEVIPCGPESLRALRRNRLERLATVLEQHNGSVRLLSRIEYLPEEERLLLRGDNSPLTIAYQDPVLRGQGLASDRLSDAIAFFDLSMREAHHLFCDCHYVGAVTSDMIAERTRSIAQQMTLREIWDQVRAAVSQHLPFKWQRSGF
jgi:hypothetical protein